MFANSTLTDRIVSSLKERDILVKVDAIESALDDPSTGQSTAEWVSKHLESDTLLSREELTLYTKLESSGALQAILLDPDLGATRPFLEDDIRTAIAALETSTAAVKKQTQTLSAQCEKIRSHLRRQESLDQDRTRDIARLRKKHEAERQNTTVTANELSDELEASFRTATDQTGAENRRILSLLSTRLKQDDKTLASLEESAAGIKSTGNNASTVKRAAHLSAMLADHTSEEIHYRLDRLYLEAVQESSPAPHNLTTMNVSITALEEELGSLYSEIEILAEMTTKQRFHEPILREIHNEHNQLHAASQQKMEQMLDILIGMTLSKRAFKSQIADRESSCELMEQFAILYQNEVTSQLVAQPPSRRESLRRRSLQAGVFLAATRHPDSIPEQPILENLLRRIGLSSGSVLRPRAEDGGAHELHEKRAYMVEALVNLGAVADSPITAHLTPSDNTSSLLASSLLANSNFETSLRDSGQEEALLSLEAELASLQKGVQGLDLEVLHRRNQTQDRLLERWG
ncbi:uncharacterized protein N7459_002110 [Penicillium hispanicum]|uniref:uncharacterized protein n=1 Tax=Penicillium hispanicum TaxID=1080232 RepID=UPI00253FF000|nr:uncharacterized protein N7459_002110 [Penicillium hispanicum]KAJ5591741.1 hypothetical protein N7459_002110 [Penicillium hispanicum]